MIVALAWLSVANAQSAVRLVAGEPEFGSCLQSTSCADSFYRFLSHSMLEQGFTMQHGTQLTSSALFRGEGFVLGAMADTFPFTAPRKNLSGKEENTEFSPVLPRIVAGWLGPGPKDGHLGAGLFFLPPIPFRGASALVVGGDFTAAWDVGERGRIGGELDLTVVRARAPITASEEQYENREDLANPNNLDPEVYEAVCLPQPNGCIDTFTLVNPGLRVAASWDVGAGIAPYAKLGAAWVHERLWVNYDDTTWGVDGVQFSAHLGGTWQPVDRLHLALGASTAFRPANVSIGGNAGVLFKLQGSAGWRFR